MTIKVQEALQAASGIAMRRSHQGIDVEHLLLALLEQAGGLATPILEQAGVSPTAVKNAAEQALQKLPQVQVAGAGPGQVHISPRLNQVLTQADAEMKELRDEYLSVEHVILAMVGEGGVFRT
ncbi:MAG: type VI secretion system ATPase TssH, partial [Nitrospirota bacterium]|nr:type VI secretion system ATPase TssH [Nitrospirota bacterium]